MLLSIVGAYAVNNSITDVYWMIGFGVFGYFMRHYGYPLGPVILGVILSRLLDDNWRRAIISEREDLGRFFEGVLTSPLSLVLFVSVVLIFVSQTPVWAKGKALLFLPKRKRKAMSNGSDAPDGLKLGLIGDNIARSRSPMLHRLAGEQNGIAVRYDRLVPIDLGLRFEEVFDRCTQEGYRGINVTYPYKEHATRFVRVNNPLVRAIGAVNTVIFRRRYPAGPQHRLFRLHVGLQHGPRIKCDRLGPDDRDRRRRPRRRIRTGRPRSPGTQARGSRAGESRGSGGCLAGSGPPTWTFPSGSIRKKAAEGVTGLINCTPVGMVGHEGTPLPRQAMRGAEWAFDAVYTPTDTQFLKDAAAAGLSIISGWELFFSIKAFTPGNISRAYRSTKPACGNAFSTWERPDEDRDRDSIDFG
ncbi:tripartite tricarboxylate transporter permease [Roseibium salinum]|nr:tripartite tricarboxylate transporter permease [Roseibium salinum]